MNHLGQLSIQELVPAYTGLPAPLSKRRAVQLIVMGRMCRSSNYHHRESAYGKGNAAARRAGVRKPKFKVV